MKKETKNKKYEITETKYEVSLLLACETMGRINANEITKEDLIDMPCILTDLMFEIAPYIEILESDGEFISLTDIQEVAQEIADLITKQANRAKKQKNRRRTIIDNVANSVLSWIQ